MISIHVIRCPILTFILLEFCVLYLHYVSPGPLLSLSRLHLPATSATTAPLTVPHLPPPLPPPPLSSAPLAKAAAKNSLDRCYAPVNDWVSMGQQYNITS